MLSQNEIRRIEKTLDILEEGFVKRGLALGASILPEIRPYVEDIFNAKDPKNADDFEMPGRKRYMILFKRYIQELFAQGMNLADMELQERRAQFDEQMPKPQDILPVEAMNWIDKWTEYFGNDYYGDVTQDVVRALKQGLAEGLTVNQTMDRLSNYLSGPGFNERRLEIIARTNSTTAFNQGRLETFRQAGDFVEHVQFLAILDSRTTDICESRNGKIFRLDDPALAANTPPLHYNCRSILSPVTQYDLDEMQRSGWKDQDGKTLEELLDHSGMPDPAKGFGKNMGNKVPQISGGSGENKPPVIGGSGGGPMEPKEPWKKIPDWFYDDKPISNDDVENDESLRIYQGIQKYFGKNISPRAVDEFLFGDNAEGVKLINLESESSGSPDKWTIKAILRLPNGNDAEFKQTFNKAEKGLYIDLLKSLRREDVFPKGFPQEYFKRSIPALRELGIEKIELNAYSNYSAGYYGAYVWSRYGFTNKNMKLTLQKYILYLEDYHSIYLDSKQRNAIMKIDRMNKLADEKIKGKEIAKEMLLGKRTTCDWNGIIPDIFNEKSSEMDELIKYIQKEEGK